MLLETVAVVMITLQFAIVLFEVTEAADAAAEVEVAFPKTSLRSTSSRLLLYRRDWWVLEQRRLVLLLVLKEKM